MAFHRHLYNGIFIILDEDQGHSGLAGQTLQESVERRQKSMSSVKRDAGEDFVFRAVPVVVSPTLSFSMKLNSADIKPKAPLTWATELASEKESKDLTAGKRTKQIYKAPEPKKETRMEPVSKKYEKPTSVIGKKVDKPASAVVQKSKSSANLNPSLQPRSAGSIPSPSTAGQKSGPLGKSKSAGIISLGEFLKQQLSNEEEEEPKPEAFVQKKGNAIVTTKNKPGPSINTKPASPTKQTSSFYGRAKEASSSKVPSFSIGKKTTTGTSLIKPGIYSSGKPQVAKPAASSHMSKTLSSWKKSRAVKSSGL